MQLNLFFLFFVYNILSNSCVGNLIKNDNKNEKKTIKDVLDISSQPNLNKLDEIVSDTGQLLIPLANSPSSALFDNEVSLLVIYYLFYIFK